MVANHPSGFFDLAAAPRQPLAVAAWPTSPRKTRVGVFRHRSSGQTSSQRRCRSIITPGSRRCGYKTVSGRHGWLNRDPIGERGGLNLYGYVDNNPINYVDLVGLSRALAWAAYGATAGTVGALAGSVLADAYTGGANAFATPAEAGLGAAAGGAIGYAAGWWADLLTGTQNVPAMSSQATVVSSSFPPGYWAGDKGAEEWGRRNGVCPDEARGDFHDIKGGDNMSGAADKYGVNPATGDVIDPEGNIIGNLGE